jgi:SAM-dependent methyltransferase
MTHERTSTFTAHNIRLDDGTFTFPQAATVDQRGNFHCVKNLLHVLYPNGWSSRSIVDLGCLEGGFATEFARLGLKSTGIDVRESNIANAEYIRSKTNLPDLHFIRDDAWNVAKYGPFDLVFCVGLHYHIDDQRRFLREMGRACRKAIFIDTHFAPEFDDHPAVTFYRLSELTTHEGLPGRWYPEHELDAASEQQRLEQLKWASWANKRSFWPTRGSLIQAMRDAGFSSVFEDFDQLNSPVGSLSPDGWMYRYSRAMFVGVKPDETRPSTVARPAAIDPSEHALDGRRRSQLSAKTAPSPMDAASLENERLQGEIHRIYASNSWKLTAPLRALRRLLRI